MSFDLSGALRLHLTRSARHVTTEGCMAFLERGDPLRELIAAIVHDEGLELYDVEMLHSQSLRLSVALPTGVDREASEGKTDRGVSVGDCTKVLRRLMVVLRAEGHLYRIAAEPEIDVSSPGVNRSLRLPEHFVGALGERVKVVLMPSREAVLPDGKKLSMLNGSLERYEDGRLTVKDELSKAVCEVPLADVKRANVEYQFS